MSYWGLYCEQCDVWFRQSTGLLVFYPAPEIANADARDLGREAQQFGLAAQHLWKEQEFGKQEKLAAREGRPVCPVLEREIWYDKNRDSIAKAFQPKT